MQPPAFCQVYPSLPPPPSKIICNTPPPPQLLLTTCTTFTIYANGPPYILCVKILNQNYIVFSVSGSVSPKSDNKRQKHSLFYKKMCLKSFISCGHVCRLTVRLNREDHVNWWWFSCDLSFRFLIFIPLFHSQHTWIWMDTRSYQ